MSTKGYAVLRRGSEYNDEIESLKEGGEVEKVFVDKPKAEAYVDELFYKEFKNGFDFSLYCYGIEDIIRGNLSLEKFIERYNKIVDEKDRVNPGNDDYYRLEINKANREQAAALRKLFKLDLFYIEEVEIE